jgi:hypothetical protein
MKNRDDIENALEILIFSLLCIIGLYLLMINYSVEENPVRVWIYWTVPILIFTFLFTFLCGLLLLIYYLEPYIKELQYDKILRKIDKFHKKGKQDKLSKIAKNNQNNEKLCLSALEKLDTQKYQNVFAEIAENNKNNSEIRRIALEKLDTQKYQNVFAEIAKDNKNDCWPWNVSYVALEKLDSEKCQDIVIQIAKDNSVHWFLRTAALRKLDSEKHQGVFAEIAKDNQSDNITRVDSLEKLDVQRNQDTFAEINTDTKLLFKYLNKLNPSERKGYMNRFNIHFHFIKAETVVHNADNYYNSYTEIICNCDCHFSKCCYEYAGSSCCLD